MTSIEATLFKPATQATPGFEYELFFPDESEEIQTKINNFGWISVHHLPGPLDMVRIEEKNDHPSKKTYHHIDLQPGLSCRVYASSGGHSYILFRHLPLSPGSEVSYNQSHV